MVSFKRSYKEPISLNNSSPSFKRSYKKSISINNLPEDLLLEICLCVGTSSLSEIHKLQKVSKSFQRFCNERYVLHQLSLHDIDRFIWCRNRHENFTNFFNRCVENENPEALYRKGLVDYFHQTSDEQRDRGIEYLAKSAKKGYQKAQYAYGILLICIGGKTKHMGFKILSAIKKNLVSDTMEEMEKFRKNIRDKIWWRGTAMMRQLKGSYVRENCGCNGETEKFMKRCVWHRYGEGKNMLTSSACEICFWHHEVELFLKFE